MIKVNFYQAGLFFIYMLYSTSINGESYGALNGLELDASLVRAQVVAVDEDQKDRLVATMEILHVYVGQMEAKGKKFSCLTGSWGSYGFTVIPTLTLHEEGIWWITIDQNKPSPLLHSFMGIPSPSRKSIDDRYNYAVKLAESIEKYNEIEGIEKRKEYLIDSVFHNSPEVSAWGISVLSKNDNLSNMIELLENDDVPVFGRIAADSTLLERFGNDWGKSAARKMYLENMLSSDNLGKYDSEKLISLLDRISQQNTLKYSEVLSLIEVAVSNKNMPKSARDGVFHILGVLSQKGKDDGMAFDVIVTEIKKGRKSARAAGYAIKNFLILNEEQKEILIEMTKEISDPELVAILHDVIR